MSLSYDYNTDRLYSKDFTSISGLEKQVDDYFDAVVHSYKTHNFRELKESSVEFTKVIQWIEDIFLHDSWTRKEYKDLVLQPAIRSTVYLLTVKRKYDKHGFEWKKAYASIQAAQTAYEKWKLDQDFDFSESLCFDYSIEDYQIE